MIKERQDGNESRDESPQKKRGGCGIMILGFLVFLAFILVGAIQKNQTAVTPRTDVTVVSRSNPAAQITLQPGVDHFVVFKTPGTLVHDVPVVVQAVNGNGSPVSREVTLSPSDKKKDTDMFGFRTTAIRVRLAPGQSAPTTVWIRPT